MRNLSASSDKPGEGLAFFRGVLAVAVGVSLTANATHAVLHSRAHVGVSAAVAFVPPLALMAAVHGVAVLARARQCTAWARSVSMVCAAVIGCAAGWLSLSALHSLAVYAGVSGGVGAWLWPVAIEGSMLQATVALLVLTRHRPPQPPVSSVTRVEQVDSDIVDYADADARAEGDVWDELSRRICGRRDPALVATVLRRHHEDGWHHERIAAEVRRDRTTVCRIIQHAHHAAGTTGVGGPEGGCRDTDAAMLR